MDRQRDYIPQETSSSALRRNFGQVRLTTRTTRLDTRCRPVSSWQARVAAARAGASLAVNLGYFRTWYGNFTVTGQSRRQPVHYDEYCITRRPTPSYCARQRISDWPTWIRSKFGLSTTTTMDKFGKRTEASLNGVDVTMNWRLPNAGLIAGCVVRAAVADECDVVVDSP